MDTNLLNVPRKSTRKRIQTTTIMPTKKLIETEIVDTTTSTTSEDTTTIIPTIPTAILTKIPTKKMSMLDVFTATN